MYWDTSVAVIADEQLDKFAHRLVGAVVLVTGGANGIGREVALRCAKHGAKIVIGDRDVQGAEDVCSQIASSGGKAISLQCDVTSWEDQVALFDAALQRFGTINVVIANAGVTEKPGLGELQFVDGKPVKPNLATTHVNMVGVMYTTHLAVHYLRETHTEGALKSLVYLASMASIFTLGGAPQYTAAKHGILGLMRAIAWPQSKFGVKITAVAPWFVDTAILPSTTKALLSGLPYVPLDRTAGAILYAATEPDAATTGGSLYTLADGTSALMRFPPGVTASGVQAELATRLDAVFGLLALQKRAPQLLARVGFIAVALAGLWVAYTRVA